MGLKTCVAPCDLPFPLPALVLDPLPGVANGTELSLNLSCATCQMDELLPFSETHLPHLWGQ